MNVIFSTGSKLPARVTPERESEREGATAYVYGLLLLLAVAVLPALLQVLTFLPRI